jgi:hypothetical protein
MGHLIRLYRAIPELKRSSGASLIETGSKGTRRMRAVFKELALHSESRWQLH